ncbi:MAG: prephenate dehydratase [Deltaproteobacteria bacterium]|nr:prephenate dehydratase [Deltaproteobacteria bacterium]MBW2121763.1 prephenate dehydratase [Deltaproteobacteria bacterium]
MKVAFQGERGAYSEMACYDFFGTEVTALPFATLSDVFNAVSDRTAEMGIVPIENTYAGTITKTYELLLAYDLFIVGETYQRIVHCLLANPGANLRQIRRVYSHPQALEQCERFTTDLGFEPVPVRDTAGGARMVRENGRLDEGAIAHEACANIYGLDLLKKSIETNPKNSTRFVVISRRHLKVTEDVKTSLVFATRHIPAALYKCLGGFATNGVNLTKIESTPNRNEGAGYLFYLDLDGHPEDTNVREALRELDFFASFVKILGSYPKETFPPT